MRHTRTRAAHTQTHTEHQQFPPPGPAFQPHNTRDAQAAVVGCWVETLRENTGRRGEVGGVGDLQSQWRFCCCAFSGRAVCVLCERRRDESPTNAREKLGQNLRASLSAFSAFTFEAQVISLLIALRYVEFGPSCSTRRSF